MESAHQLVFGPFRLDPVANCLWRGDQSIELQPRPLAVLRYLAERPGQVITKEELLKQVWAGTYVTKTVLKVSIRAIREALKDEANAPHYIETVGREGYRFLRGVVSSQHSGDSSSLSFTQHTAHGAQHSVVVGRAPELAQLQSLLGRAMRGQRQVVFVTGDPGVGKTTLVDLFLERVRAAGESWTARGQCLEQYGEGEAYLPMLEAFRQLCQGPGGKQALSVLQRHAPTWVVQMPALVADTELESLQRKVAGATRERMLREMAEALEALTEDRGLVLLLEDLHVSDRSTVELLAYLAQRRERAKFLVLGTYRPTDVVVREHPLKGIKQELSAKGQCEELRVELLTQEEVKEYVTKRLTADTVPAQLTQLIYQRTDGNALFMANVVEYCLQQELVVQENGRWKLTKDTELLGVPESIQQMIVKQVERLTEDEQRVLELAGVVGSEFTVATVAAVLQSDLNVVEETCEELARKSLFLREEGVIEWPDGTLSGRYAFRHVLYQNVLYARIAEARRVRLHRLIGERQEQAYGARVAEIAAELAMHFERARDHRRAVQYLQLAGENAIRQSAYQEAISYLTRGVEFLKVLPDTAEHRQRELDMQLALGLPLITIKGYAAPEVEHTYARTRNLCQHMGETWKLFSALLGLWVCYLARAECKTARELAEQALSLAQKTERPIRLVWGHNNLGHTLFHIGEFAFAREHSERGLLLYDPHKHTPVASGSVQDPRVSCLCFAGLALWWLGYPDQALRKMHEALALAQELAHHFSLAFALNYAAILHQFRRECLAAQKQAGETRTLSREQGFVLWLAQGTILQGWAFAKQGKRERGITQMRQGLTICRSLGAEMFRPYFLALLAEAYGEIGQVEAGLALLTEALVTVESTGEGFYVTELYRLKGELTLQRSSIQSLGSSIKKSSKLKVQSAKSKKTDPRSLMPDAQDEAEACFLKAIASAQRQQAKSLELRATMSLARLWRRQGKRHEAHDTLAEIYNWFTEGFDTKDLQEAQALLMELRD